jgi:hypothetical protein
MAQPEKVDPNTKNASDLHPEDLKAIGLLFTRLLAGVSATAAALKGVEGELTRIGTLPENVVPIAGQKLNQARNEYRKTLARVAQMATALGITIPVGLLPSDISGDVGAVSAQSLGVSEAAFKRMTGDIIAGGIVPSASFITVGEGLAGKAIAKLGAGKAVAAGRAFASFSAANARRAAALIVRAGGKFVTPAMETAIVGAVSWFAAATAIRIAAPGIGAGLGNLLSTPGGIVLVVVAGYFLLNRR